jgi:type IV pilus assembly protein PilP
MKKLFSTLGLTALLSGCGANIDDLIAYTEQVKANTQVSIEEYPEFKPLPSVSYSSARLRSPFIRSKNELIVETPVERPNCMQPNPNRRKQALESFGLDGLQMAGVFTNKGSTYALIKANDGSLHKVTTGSYIGLFHGRVTTIKNTEILITEMLPDGAGCWKSKQATLTRSSMAGENNDV